MYSAQHVFAWLSFYVLADRLTFVMAFRIFSKLRTHASSQWPFSQQSTLRTMSGPKYMVTHQVVTNLPLTSKQKFPFGLVCPSLARPKQNFVSMSMGGSPQPDVSPCSEIWIVERQKMALTACICMLRIHCFRLQLCIAISTLFFQLVVQLSTS